MLKVFETDVFRNYIVGNFEQTAGFFLTLFYALGANIEFAILPVRKR